MARKPTPKRASPTKSGSKKPDSKKRLAKKAVAKVRSSARPRRGGKAVTRIKPWSEAEVRAAFERFRKASPEPRGELEHINPYTLLVAVALSAQATDAGVNRATRNLFPIADTPEKMVALGEDNLRELIK